MNEWQWDGKARHLILAHRCRFGISTWLPGRFLVSTVGHLHGSEQGVNACEDGAPLTPIVMNAYYETLVFTCNARGYPKDLSEVDRILVRRDRAPATGDEIEEAEDEAMKGHLDACRKWLK